MGGGMLINWYKNRMRGNQNTTNVIDLGNDIYDLDKEKLAAIEKRAKLLDIEEEDDDKL